MPHAWIAGEHGDSEFPLWSSATVGAMPVEAFSLGGRRPLDEEGKQRIAAEVVGAAEQIIRGKGATNYAIGLAGARLVEAILNHQRKIWPLSSVLTGPSE